MCVPAWYIVRNLRDPSLQLMNNMVQLIRQRQLIQLMSLFKLLYLVPATNAVIINSILSTRIVQYLVMIYWLLEKKLIRL